MFKATDRNTGLIHAVKIVNVDGDVDSVQKEIDVLSSCKSPYIVSYNGSYLYEDNLWVPSRFAAVMVMLMGRRSVRTVGTDLIIRPIPA